VLPGEPFSSQSCKKKKGKTRNDNRWKEKKGGIRKVERFVLCVGGGLLVSFWEKATGRKSREGTKIVLMVGKPRDEGKNRFMPKEE